VIAAHPGVHSAAA